MESKPWLNQPNALWRRIRDRIEERMVILEAGVMSLLDRPLRDHEVETCVGEGQLLADWLFALGIDVGGRLARDVAEAFADEKLTSHAAGEIAAQIEDLRRFLQLASHEWTAVRPSGIHIHVISPIDARIDAVMWHLQQRGILVTHSPTFMSAPEDAQAVVIYAAANLHDSVAILGAISRRSSTARRIVIHNGQEAVARLTEIAPQTDLLLSHSESVPQIADEIHSISLADKAWQNRVVLLGASDAYRALRPYDLDLRIASDLDGAVETLATECGTLVIGPEVINPDEVLALIRSTPATRDALVAVVGVSGVTAQQCRRMGAALVVDPERDPDVWATHLRGLMARRRHMTDDDETLEQSIPDWPRAVVMFERSLASLGRTSAIASLALIRLPPMTEGEAETFRAALSREFRRADVVGYTDDGDVIVLLLGASLKPATARIQIALDHLSLAHTSGCVGIAEFPTDGHALSSLLDGAGAASIRAREAGGPAVVSSDWHPGYEEVADVMLVESNPTLASVLDQLLGQLGLRTTHVQTGSHALRSLIGKGAVPLPRLLVLELDAMGADGLMILRSLARQGVLGRMKIMVTCARVRDGELREAFELGASDVVVKPFSAVVLSNRIQLLLEGT